MGTRADLYVGRGPGAEWLGSVAWDGNEMLADVQDAASEDAYRGAVARFLAARDDATTPDMGWPWPWDDSHTTDVAWAWDEGRTWWTMFGRGWLPAGDGVDDEAVGEGPVVFPDMSARKNVTLGSRSGLIIFER